MMTMTPRQRLLALPAGHQHRRFAEGDYRPQSATDDARWRLVVPLAEQVLADHVAGNPTLRDSRQRDFRRVVCTYLHWLFGEVENPTVAVAFNDLLLVRYTSLLDNAPRTCSVTLSQLRSFQRLYPRLYPPAPKPPFAGYSPPPVLLTDAQFDLAYALTDTFLSEHTCYQSKAVLLLGRSAGLTGADMAWVTGHHVTRVPNAGLWVEVPAGARRPRNVPVIARYAPRLERLAERAGDGLLVWHGPAPAPEWQVSEVCRWVERKVRNAGEKFNVRPQRLRGTWEAEHLSHDRVLMSFLAAAGLTTFSALDRLVPSIPPVADTPAVFARALGAVDEGVVE